jgi:uncharacterized protein (TIGR02171 family)
LSGGSQILTARTDGDLPPLTNADLPFRKLRIAGPVWICGLAVCGCLWVQEPETPLADAANPPGMVLIRAKGRSFTQGSQAGPSAADELPAFEQRFKHDYFMDTAEVTQGDYASLMGPLPGAAAFGSGPAYPVYGVSWFDAALYANARSKAEGMDTVYEYARADRTASGSVYDLPGLRVRLERAGFRLPTESEWEFAAGPGGKYVWGNAEDSAQAARNAWFASNSGGITHPVGLLSRNAFGLHDMAGNVMEWVGDWKGRYPKGGMSDFAGSREPGPQGEVPLKGGAFRYGMRELRVANRATTYPAIRSSTAEYVGFRCAFGAIPEPAYTLADGGQAETEPVQLERMAISDRVGFRPAKLVFVNANGEARHLAYVDYGKQPITVREFGDVANVFHPSISPDGQWVAYGTAAEGAVSGSDLYVRRLDADSGRPLALGSGFIPRWWVDPATRDTFLLYTTTAADDLQSNWGQGSTRALKMADGKPSGAAIDLASGAFHDGRSADGKWMAAGFRRLLMRDGASGSVRTLFTAPANGKAAGDTSQVCNVSMAPDSSGRLLFLDFGYAGTSALTGSWYDIHAMAFLSGPDGTVQAWYPAPGGEQGWDDLEWSNQAGYAVAAATDRAGGHGRLYLLDLADSSTTLLASGSYLTTPALWLGAAPRRIPELSADSLGRYNEPATDGFQGTFSMRMARFWQRHKSLEVIFTGSSHAWSGIDPTLITRLRPLNQSYPRCGWLGQEEWIRGYALPHCPRLKMVVMEIAPGFMQMPDGDGTWNSQISRTIGVRYDSSHGFWKNGLPDGFEAMAAQAPVWDGVPMDSLGTIRFESGGWGEAVLYPGSDFGFDDPACQAVLARIEAFADELAGRGIHLLLVNYPTHPGFGNTPFYGPYGPRDEVAGKILDRVREMERKSPFVHFYDAHLSGNHDYDDSDALDFDHLSSKGAAKLTRRLDSLINTIVP